MWRTRSIDYTMGPDVRLGTEHTLQFVTRWLASPSARLLEIGCGDGELAAELRARGYEVVAIDSNPAAVAEARSRGVDARVATWPDFSDGRFDAVLFTRSIHHMPLGEAVDRAAATAPRLIVEDFALVEVSPPFVDWLRRVVPDWEPHDVHAFADVRQSIERRFTILHEEDAPYVYRYFPEEETQRIYQEELELGERVLGRRLVADLRHDRFVASAL